jgi:hypothetical protein
MNTVTVEAEVNKEQVLTLNDRCDTGGCSAAALVLVRGIASELMFCGHHYERYEGSPKMQEFAFEIIDERWTIANENRLKD